MLPGISNQKIPALHSGLDFNSVLEVVFLDKILSFFHTCPHVEKTRFDSLVHFLKTIRNVARMNSHRRT